MGGLHSEQHRSSVAPHHKDYLKPLWKLHIPRIYPILKISKRESRKAKCLLGIQSDSDLQQSGLDDSKNQPWDSYTTNVQEQWLILKSKSFNMLNQLIYAIYA